MSSRSPPPRWCPRPPLPSAPPQPPTPPSSTPTSWRCTASTTARGASTSSARTTTTRAPRTSCRPRRCSGRWTRTRSLPPSSSRTSARSPSSPRPTSSRRCSRPPTRASPSSPSRPSPRSRTTASASRATPTWTLLKPIPILPAPTHLPPTRSRPGSASSWTSMTRTRNSRSANPSQPTSSLRTTRSTNATPICAIRTSMRYSAWNSMKPHPLGIADSRRNPASTSRASGLARMCSTSSVHVGPVRPIRAIAMTFLRAAADNCFRASSSSAPSLHHGGASRVTWTLTRPASAMSTATERWMGST
mmetsp:Transcript_27171/g.76405  ORF Transcript_27171/g.76405 Transcript_27171/m.76405 type:complete len:304 (+) Transcript_27171:600-1511(+)